MSKNKDTKDLVTWHSNIESVRTRLVNCNKVQSEVYKIINITEKLIIALLDIDSDLIKESILDYNLYRLLDRQFHVEVE